MFTSAVTFSPSSGIRKEFSTEFRLELIFNQSNWVIYPKNYLVKKIEDSVFTLIIKKQFALSFSPNRN